MRDNFKEKWNDFAYNPIKICKTRTEIQNVVLELANMAEEFDEIMKFFVEYDFGRIDTSEVFVILKNKLFKIENFLGNLKKYFEKAPKSLVVRKGIVELLIDYLNQVSNPLGEWFKVYNYCEEKKYFFKEESFEILRGVRDLKISLKDNHLIFYVWLSLFVEKIIKGEFLFSLILLKKLLFF